jgi:putative phage-type endonuclease
MNFVSYVDDVVKEYKRMRILDISDPKYIDDIYKIVKTNFSYFMKEEEIKLSFQCINDILKKNDFIRYEEWCPTTLDVNPDIIIALEKMPQPDQKSNEWYIFRHDHITASNAWKALSSQSNKNQLIYEKCLPMNTDKFKPTLNENSLTWGHKYEPLSTKMYELKMNTQVKEFGCIEHPVYKFLAASPDGIVVGENNYGRMLEIKNVVSRVIDGSPKKEYYIQMQLQMEVCNLDECDFLETKFTEYTNYMSYLFDTSNELYEDEDGLEFQNTCLSKDNKIKGIIIYFHTAEGKPFYLYKPLDIIHPKEIEEWQDKNIDFYNKPEYKYVFMKTIYWKLDIISCVLVCRNKQWFNDNISKLQEIWTIIEQERISGYEHRAPNRKPKKEFIDITTPITSKCLLQFNNKINVIKKDIDNTSYVPIPELINIDIDYDKL